MNRGFQHILLQLLLFKEANCFWDTGTTSTDKPYQPKGHLFRWHWTYPGNMSYWFGWYDWASTRMRRKLRCVAGIDSIPLGTATLLNERTLISSATFIDPFMHRQQDLRIWVLGRKGVSSVPYRYRVRRVKRLFPKSEQPKLWHGSHGEFVPQHDVALIYSSEKIYFYASVTRLYNYPYKARIPEKADIDLNDDDNVWFTRSGHEDEDSSNYNIKYGSLNSTVNCSVYIPKKWGKFICVLNVENFSGLDSGAGLYVSKGGIDFIVGVGCFEYTIDGERIFVFTDLRFYLDWINLYTNITLWDYYFYAYPNWLSSTGIHSRDMKYDPFVPHWHGKLDLYPPA